MSRRSFYCPNFATAPGDAASPVEAKTARTEKPAVSADEQIKSEKEEIRHDIAALKRQINELEEEKKQLEGEQTYVQTALEHARAGRDERKRALRTAKDARASRGRFAKCLKPDEGRDTIERLEAELEREENTYLTWQKRQGGLKEAHSELHKRQIGIEKQIKTKENDLSRLNLLGHRTLNSEDALERLSLQWNMQRRRPSNYSRSNSSEMAVQETQQEPYGQSNDVGMEM